MTVEVHPLPGALGAQIIGADLSRPGDDAPCEAKHTRHMHRTTIKGNRPA